MGNVFHFSNDSCKSLIEQFLSTKPKVKENLNNSCLYFYEKTVLCCVKECLLEVYRKLSECFPANESNKEKKTFRINAESIKNQIRNNLK